MLLVRNKTRRTIRFNRTFTKSDPNELVDKMRLIINEPNKSSEEILDRAKSLLENEQKEPDTILCGLRDLFACGLLVSLYIIAVISAFAGLYHFADQGHGFMTFVCFVLFITLMLPLLA